MSVLTAVWHRVSNMKMMPGGTIRAKFTVRGNALFLILIAVALFAALSYAVTQSGRGSGTINKETASLNASRVISFLAMLDGTVTRMRLTNNLDVTDLSFRNNAYLRYDNAATNGALGVPATPSLHLFHPQGGGATPVLFEDMATQPCPACSPGATRNGHIKTLWVNVPGVGTTDSDLAFTILQFPDDMCRAFNAQYGISPQLPAFAWAVNNFTTGAARPATAAMSGGDVAAINGQRIFCFKETVFHNRNVLVYVFREY